MYFHPDLVWRMQLKVKNTNCVCIELLTLLIEFVIPNQSRIYFCIPDIFRMNV